jgi:hypothetical protein
MRMDGDAERGKVVLRRGGFRRRLGSRRGVLEGLPLSLLISILIMAIGIAVLVALFAYGNGQHLASLGLTTGSPPTNAVHGYLYGPWTGLHLSVTAYSASGNPLGEVLVKLNGSGYNTQEFTSPNGSAGFFLPPPSFAYHATSGVLTVSATYAPPPGFGASPEGTSVQVVILE